jgi:membrane fusion protein, copper/silver efflux system
MTTTKSTHAVLWLVTGAALGAASYWGVTALGSGDTKAEAAAPSAQMEGMDMSGGSGMDMDMGTSMVVSGAARLTPSEIQQFGVTFGSAEERPLVAEVRTVGFVGVAEPRVVEITTKFPGYVERLYADFVGESVRKGDPLLDIYAPDLVSAQEEVLLARSLSARVGGSGVPGLPTGSVDLETTSRRRLILWDIGDDQIDALLKEGRPTRTLSLRAPISGVVLDKSIVQGAAFAAGETLFRIADLSVVWIDVEIREAEASWVGTGASAAVTLTAYPGERFGGTVDFIYPTVDERTRSVRARVAVPNPGGRLRPGMYATLRLSTPQRALLSVPASAVVRTGDSDLVFVADDDGVLRPVEVRLGPTIGENTVVLEGLEAGTRVVTSAQYLIDAEANIGAIMRSMMSMMGAGDMSGMDMEGM